MFVAQISRSALTPVHPLRRRLGVGLRVLLDVPGRIEDVCFGEAALSPCANGDRRNLVRLAVNAPRTSAYLALEDGLRVFTHGPNALAFHMQGRNVFAVGGPLGPVAGYDALLRAFADALRVSGVWNALVFSVSDDEEVAAARRAGWDVVHAGSEPLCDPTAFSTRGRRREDLRQMVNRAVRRFGLRAGEADPNVDAAAMQAVYDAWLDARPARHAHRLLIGTPRLHAPEGRRYFAVSGPGGVVAFCSLTPGRDGSAWGIDVFARRPDAPAGAMDLLILRAIETLGAEGVRRFSLGACPMCEAAPPDPRRDTWLRPAFRLLFATALGDAIFPFRSLAYFKGKFADWWEPVYLAARPGAGPWTLYTGCRMWGLFG